MFTFACSYASVERWVGKFLQATHLPLQESRGFGNTGKLL
jgi:hypothetical protein